MSWISLTSTQAKARLAGAEYNAIKAAALNSGQDADTLVTDTLSRVVKDVRGYVGGCSRNLLGDGDTIPDELEDAALALFVYRFLTRLPNMKALLDPQRVAAYGDALKKLEQTAACKFAIVQPTTPAADEEQSGGGNMEVIASRTRVAKREGTAGLL